jgi:hypothetical protein
MCCDLTCVVVLQKINTLPSNKTHWFTKCWTINKTKNCKIHRTTNETWNRDLQTTIYNLYQFTKQQKKHKSMNCNLQAIAYVNLSNNKQNTKPRITSCNLQLLSIRWTKTKHKTKNYKLQVLAFANSLNNAAKEQNQKASKI